MDAILSLGVTHLVDLLTNEKVDLSVLSLDQRRDLLLLAALYDASTGEPIARRWSRLRRRSGFRPLWTRRDLQIGFGTTLLVVGLIAMFPSLMKWSILPWLLLPILAGWLYWGWRLARAEWFARDIRKGLRVLNRDPSALRWELLWFKPTELGGQPLPTATRVGAEERYELLRKFQGVLHTLGYAGIIVLIDRVDEPQQVEGDPAQDARLDLAAARSQVPPASRHRREAPAPDRAGLLPREGRQGVLRPRPARQAQHDQAAALDRPVALRPGLRPPPRLPPRAVEQRRRPRLRKFIDDAISDDYLKESLANLRTPRHLFKFLHRLIEEHCHRHTEDAPRWTIDYDTFRTTYGAYMRDLEAFDRGYGHG